MPRTDRKIDALSQHPLLAGLTRRQLRQAASTFDEVDVEAGTVLMQQGRLSREVYLLSSGTVQVVRDGCPVATLGAGDVVGEVGVLQHRTRNATVTTTSDVRAWVAPAQAITSLLAAAAPLQQRIAARAAGRA